VSLWAIVPVKDPDLAKSRLADQVPPSARRSFTLQSLEHVIGVLRETPGVDRCLVISRSAAALAVAQGGGAQAVQEAHEVDSAIAVPGAGLKGSDAHLNAALEQAARTAVAGGASAILVLPSDLPLVARGSLEHMIAMLGGHEGLVIAPDRHLRGTNALLVRPPLALSFCFGADSLARHRSQAETQGLLVRTFQSDDLALDIDTMEDVEALSAEGGRAQRGRDDTSEQNANSAPRHAWALRALTQLRGTGTGSGEQLVHGH
jgi:2-phospho-L-lactate guanylyltransferase